MCKCGSNEPTTPVNKCGNAVPKTACDYYFTGDIIYDGEDLLCGQEVIIANGDKMNNILANLVARICILENA